MAIGSHLVLPLFWVFTVCKGIVWKYSLSDDLNVGQRRVLGIHRKACRSQTKFWTKRFNFKDVISWSWKQVIIVLNKTAWLDEIKNDVKDKWDRVTSKTLISDRAGKTGSRGVNPWGVGLSLFLHSSADFRGRLEFEASWELFQKQNSKTGQEAKTWLSGLKVILLN